MPYPANAEMRTDLPSEQYHADADSVGIGGLSLLRKSPLHHWHHCRRPNRAAAPPTEAQAFGAAVHCLVLEPEQFESRYAVRPEGIDRRYKEGKAAYAEFEATLAGRLELKAEAFARVSEIAGSVRSNAVARTLLEGPGHREASVYWTDRETGVRCRCRPDFAPLNGIGGAIVLVDLKCTTDASGPGIARTALNLGWLARAAWYVDGWKALTGETREYIFLCWETDAPFATAKYAVEDDLLEIGRSHESLGYHPLLRKYAECLSADKWPGYFEGVQPLLLPNWYK